MGRLQIKFKYEGKEWSSDTWRICSLYKGNKIAPKDDPNEPHNYNNHIITIVNENTGERCRFEWWGALLGGEIKTEKELRGVFLDFLLDCWAWVSNRNFSDFCSSLCLDENEKSSKKKWDACQRTATEKLERIWPDYREKELMEILNYLEDLDMRREIKKAV